MALADLIPGAIEIFRDEGKKSAYKNFDKKIKD